MATSSAITGTTQSDVSYQSMSTNALDVDTQIMGLRNALVLRSSNLLTLYHLMPGSSWKALGGGLGSEHLHSNFGGFSILTLKLRGPS